MPDVTQRDPATLDQIVKAYDVRGVVPDQLDEALAHDGRRGVRPASSAPATRRRDRRGRPRHAPSRPRAGGGVRRRRDRRRAPTSSRSAWPRPTSSTSPPATSDLPGAMFTASHNPAQYNGIKLCRAGAAPVGQETGLARDQAHARPSGVPGSDGPAGTVTQRDLLADYAAYLREPRRPLRRSGRSRVVVDAGNGMGGHTVPAVFDGPAARRVDPAVLRARRHVPEPRGQPDRPGEPARPAGARCSSTGADLGLAFDGDADRCFVVDERGEIVDPSTLTALIADRELAQRARAPRSSTT